MSTSTITCTVTWTAAHACTCGQDLEDIRREHCPRCGRQVAHAA